MTHTTKELKEFRRVHNADAYEETEQGIILYAYNKRYHKWVSIVPGQDPVQMGKGENPPRDAKELPSRIHRKGSWLTVHAGPDSQDNYYFQTLDRDIDVYVWKKEIDEAKPPHSWAKIHKMGSGPYEAYVCETGGRIYVIKWIKHPNKIHNDEPPF